MFGRESSGLEKVKHFQKFYCSLRQRNYSGKKDNEKI